MITRALTTMTVEQAVPLDWQGPVDKNYSAYEDQWLDEPVFHRFIKWVTEIPHAIAIHDNYGSISYAELYHYVKNLGSVILNQVKKGSAVALALPIDRHYPAAMLGALAAGRPYVPLDLTFPSERLKYILTHSGASLVLVTTETYPQVQNLLPKGVTCVNIEEKVESKQWIPQGIADDIACIVYTSGSSGQPKGVYINQRGLTHDVLQYTRSIHIAPDDVLSGLYSPNVMGSVRDIYGALLNGASIALFDLRRQGFGSITAAIQSLGITIYHAMPPVFRTHLQKHLKRGNHFHSIRLVYLAGDRLFESDLSLFKQHFSDQAFLYIGIGSTECATIYRQWFVPRTWSENTPLIPVGYAIPDRHTTIVNALGQPQPIGTPGEIIVSSRYLSRGYWRDETQTRMKFSHDSNHPELVHYHTGDIGQLRPDGLLEFLNRADRQVKIRGFRVEPSELEGALRGIDGIHDAAVIVRGQEENTCLVAYVVLSKAMDKAWIFSRLKSMLPTYLCPTEIISLDTLPTLGNFKTDYEKLKALDEYSITPSDSAIRTKPKTEQGHLTELVFTAWTQVLQLDHAILEQNFTQAGGNSLKALELHLALENLLGKKIPLTWFYQEMTLSTLITNVANAHPVHTAENKPQLIIFPPAHGLDIVLRQLADSVVSHFEVLIIHYSPEAKQFRYRFNITELAEDSLNTVLDFLNPSQKVIFLGVSYGARIAYTAAQMLSAQGKKIERLLLYDIPYQKIPHYLTPTKNIAFTDCFKFKILRMLTMSWIHKLFVDMKIPFLDHFLSGVQSLTTIFPLKYVYVVSTHILYLRRLQHWQPLPYEDAIGLIVTQMTLEANSHLPPDLGWKKLCPTLDIYPISGEHAPSLIEQMPEFLRSLKQELH